MVFDESRRLRMLVVRKHAKIIAPLAGGHSVTQRALVRIFLFFL
jgi:hypothetical protein